MVPRIIAVDCMVNPLCTLSDPPLSITNDAQDEVTLTVQLLPEGIVTVSIEPGIPEGCQLEDVPQFPLITLKVFCLAELSEVNIHNNNRRIINSLFFISAPD